MKIIQLTVALSFSRNHNHPAAYFRRWCLVVSLLCGGVLATASAQTFTNLYNFTALGFSPDSTNSDGANPTAGLVSSGNTLYGVAGGGGISGKGTVFKVNSDGTGFTTLHTFTATSEFFPYANSDGSGPQADLVLSGNTLYGTARYGGSLGGGTVFAINTDGSGFTNLHNFAYSVGGNPFAGVILSGNTLYGTTANGGSANNGTVFAVNTDGSGFTSLHNFTALVGSFPSPSTNSDGAGPLAGLILSGNTLYGTAIRGGSSGNGTVFAVNADGTGFTNLHSFTGGGGDHPQAGLILSGNSLYGTAQTFGGSGSGTVFSINTNGTGFTNLYNLGYDEGNQLLAGLILSGNTLYGTASLGGSAGHNSAGGTVFAVNTDGTSFTNLYSFTVPQIDFLGYYTNSDGSFPAAGLILSGNTLYGTAKNGGSSGNGTIFGISLPLPPNQRPIVANPIPDTNSIYGSAFTYTFAANSFSDPDGGQVLSYTAGGLPLGIAFDGPTRTFSGMPTEAGMYSVTVIATDNGSPPLGTNDNFYIVVDKAPLTVSADNTNRSYGEANPTFTGTLAGVTNSDNITATFTTSATPSSLPGDYPITPTLQDPDSRLSNYTVSTNLGTLTVNGVSLKFSLSSGSPNFCWPTNAAAFVLEYTDDLAPSGSWYEVTNGITTNGSTLCLTVTPEAVVPTRFYRLHLP